MNLNNFKKTWVCLIFLLPLLKCSHPAFSFSFSFSFFVWMLANQRLLFHGSRISNWVGILSRGLLLPHIVTGKYGGQRTDFGYLLSFSFVLFRSLTLFLSLSKVVRCRNLFWRTFFHCYSILYGRKKRHSYHVGMCVCVCVCVVCVISYSLFLFSGIYSCVRKNYVRPSHRWFSYTSTKGISKCPWNTCHFFYFF